MPDNIRDLYAANKQAAAENASNNVVTSERPAFSPNFPELKLGAGPAPEPISRYEGYVTSPETYFAYGDINKTRAQGQGIGEQLGNMALRSVANIALGAISNVAASADIEDYYNQDDEVGNAVSNTMNEWQDSIRQRFPIYRENEGKSFDVGDPGWWVDNAAMLLESAGAFVASGYATGAILGGISKSLGAGKVTKRIADAAAKTVDREAAVTGQALSAAQREAAILSKAEQIAQRKFAIPETVVNAMAMNQAEGVMEAFQVYDDVYKSGLQKGKDIDEAKQLAADAAAYDINLNRANVLLNLTSAGLFTNAKHAVKDKLYNGSKVNTILSETLQEAAEEGVNYVAQKEAMKFSENPFGYEFDAGAALDDLFTNPQGLEAMVLGAAGGAIQTAGTELFSSAKDEAVKKVKQADESVKKSNPAKMQDLANMDEHMRIMKEYHNAVAQAGTDDAAIKTASDNYLNNLGKTLVGYSSPTQLDLHIAAYQKVISDFETAQKNGDKKASDLVEIQKANEAKIALDHMNGIKALASTDKDFWTYNNKKDILEELKNNQKANAEFPPIRTEYEEYANQIDQLRRFDGAVTPEMESKLEALKVKKDKAEKALNDSNAQLQYLRSPAGQGVATKIANDTAAQMAAKTVNNSAAKVKNTTTKSSTKAMRMGVNDASKLEYPLIESKEVAGAVLNLIEHQESDMHSAVDKEFEGQEDDEIVSKTFLDEQTENGKTISNETPIISLPSINGSGKKMIKGATLLSPNGSFRSNMTAVLRVALNSALKSFDGNPELKFNFNGRRFKLKDFYEFMEAKGKPISKDTVVEAKNFTAAEVGEFLSKFPIDDKIDNVQDLEGNEESQVTPTRDVATKAFRSVRRGNPLSVNYSEEEAKFDETGTSGTGKYNEAHLLNSDPDNGLLGKKLIVGVYEENVPQISYDASGRAILDPNTKEKSKTISNAATIRDNKLSGKELNRDIPIAIWEDDGSGNKGRLIGFLPENAWLDEMEVGTSKRINVPFVPDVMSKGDYDAKIANIKAARSAIEKAYIDGEPIEFTSEVSEVSEGHPMFELTPDTLANRMPGLLSDFRDTNGFSPLARVTGGGILAEKNSEVIVENGDYLKSSYDGLPIVLVKSSNGKIIGVKAVSAKIKDVPGVKEAILNGIKLFLTRNADGIKSYNALAGVNGLTEFAENESSPTRNDVNEIRDFLKQFVFMRSIADESNSATEKPYAIVARNPHSGRLEIEYGKIKGKTKSGNRLSLDKNDAIDGDGKIKNAWLAQVNAFVEFAGEMKHNFDMTNMSSMAVISVNSDGRAIKLAKTKEEHYMNTLKTYATSKQIKGKNGGVKNIYTVHPNISMNDLKSPVKPAKKEAVSGGDLTQEEADWLYDNHKIINDTFGSATLHDAVDRELKSPLIIGDTKVTHISPDAGGERFIIIERPSGRYRIDVEEKNGRINYSLSLWRDAKGKGDFAFYKETISQEDIIENVKKAGVFDLLNEIYDDTNIPSPGSRLEIFNIQNKLQQKYGLKRTYKDIYNQLAPSPKVEVEEVSISSDLINPGLIAWDESGIDKDDIEFELDGIVTWHKISEDADGATIVARSSNGESSDPMRAKLKSAKADKPKRRALPGFGSTGEGSTLEAAIESPGIVADMENLGDDEFGYFFGEINDKFSEMYPPDERLSVEDQADNIFRFCVGK